MLGATWRPPSLPLAPGFLGRYLDTVVGTYGSCKPPRAQGAQAAMWDP